jgi:hypothetical protein
LQAREDYPTGDTRLHGRNPLFRNVCMLRADHACSCENRVGIFCLKPRESPSTIHGNQENPPFHQVSLVRADHGVSMKIDSSGTIPPNEDTRDCQGTLFFIPYACARGLSGFTSSGYPSARIFPDHKGPDIRDGFFGSATGSPLRSTPRHPDTGNRSPRGLSPLVVRPLKCTLSG